MEMFSHYKRVFSFLQYRISIRALGTLRKHTLDPLHTFYRVCMCVFDGKCAIV